jgi:uncharacterized iron-regulated membrane protein
MRRPLVGSEVGRPAHCQLGIQIVFLVTVGLASAIIIGQPVVLVEQITQFEIPAYGLGHRPMRASFDQAIARQLLLICRVIVAGAVGRHAEPQAQIAPLTVNIDTD